MPELPADITVSEALRHFVIFQIIASLITGPAGTSFGWFAASLVWGRQTNSKSPSATKLDR